MLRRFPRWIALAAAALAVVYALVYADLVLRARSAYLEGEKYMRWHARPGEKKAFFQAELAKETAALDREKSAGRLSDNEHAQRLELERFRADEALSESSLKYAYHWYKTAVDLFAPPDSRWVKLSRRRMAEAKELWKAELRAKGVPFEEYMLE